MKKNKIFIAAAFFFALASAFMPHGKLSHTNTVGKYWNAPTHNCEYGTSVFSCSVNNHGQICTDNADSSSTNMQLHDGSIVLDPCGKVIRRKN